MENFNTVVVFVVVVGFFGGLQVSKQTGFEAGEKFWFIKAI